MNATQKVIFPLLFLFVFFNLALTAIKIPLVKWGIDYNVLIIANVLFFVVNLVSFLVQKRALQKSNPNVFIRSVMGGMLIKMFACLIAVIIYKLLAGNAVSKVSVFTSMFLYLVYLVVEVTIITKLSKKNA